MRAEARGQKSEVRGQKSEVRGQKSEVRGRGSKALRAARTLLLTIDVEDWFQVENLKSCISYDSWHRRECRVEKNTHRILDLLDDCGSTQNPKPKTGNPINATFFVLGWIAERLPALVKEVHNRGHEIASHGYCHRLPTQMTPKALVSDLAESKKRLEDIIGHSVYGYRAPSFSIDENILQLIGQAGYGYDSSYNSFALHGRYGRLALSPNGRNGIAHKIPMNNRPSNAVHQPSPMRPAEGHTQSPAPRTQYPAPSNQSPTLYELPISNVECRMSNFPFSRFVLPWGGGAYFRLIPERLFQRGVRSILNRQQAYVLYLHPWELDPDQPRAPVGVWKGFRHYTHLCKTEGRLKRMVSAFSHCRFMSCREYLSIETEA